MPTLLVNKDFKAIERFLSFLSARLKKRAWKDLYPGSNNLFIFYLFVSQLTSPRTTVTWAFDHHWQNFPRCCLVRKYILSNNKEQNQLNEVLKINQIRIGFIEFFYYSSCYVDPKNRFRLLLPLGNITFCPFWFWGWEYPLDLYTPVLTHCMSWKWSWLLVKYPASYVEGLLKKAFRVGYIKHAIQI